MSEFFNPVVKLPTEKKKKPTATATAKNLWRKGLVITLSDKDDDTADLAIKKAASENHKDNFPQEEQQLLVLCELHCEFNYVTKWILTHINSL